MELLYTYEKGEKYLVGHLDEYPEYPTQGEDVNDLENIWKRFIAGYKMVLLKPNTTVKLILELFKNFSS
jgi:hypothetical protein